MLPDMFLHMAVRLLCRDNFGPRSKPRAPWAGQKTVRTSTENRGIEKKYLRLRCDRLARDLKWEASVPSWVNRESRACRGNSPGRLAIGAVRIVARAGRLSLIGE